MRRNWVFAALVLAAAGASAQTPAGLPRSNVSPAVGEVQLNDAALDGQGNVTLLWQLSPPFQHTRAQGRRFSALDVPLGPAFQLNRREREARAAANARGDTVMTWLDIPLSGPYRIMVRRVRPGQPPLTLMANRESAAPSLFAGDLDIDREGRFVVVWREDGIDGASIRGQRFNADGSRQGPIFGIDSGFAPRVAMNRRTGEFVVIFLRPIPGRVNPAIVGQRFGFTTGRQGSEFRITDSAVGNFPPNADVGRADDGSFVVAWTRIDLFGPRGDVIVQTFDPEGKRRSELVRFEASELHAALAVAPEGHFVLAWQSGERLRLSLHERDGRPAAPVQILSPAVFATLQPAFGFDGTFVLGWAELAGSVNYQRFAAAAGTEVCLFRQGRFRCDTARSGGAPEIDHVFSVRRDTPLLGDVDGDGRDDYCLFRGSRFECDARHDYGAAEFSVFFGQAGDTPLLGDVDGDGRDDPCVFRAGRFLCDLVHNNDAAELDIVFGQEGDRALLGDLDGDGLAEPCVIRSGELRCDAARNGGAAEIVIPFTLGGTPLLGDFDGDGRDDPCAFSGRRLACDTAHNGGGAEATLALSGQGIPLIGNVDGI